MRLRAQRREVLPNFAASFRSGVRGKGGNDAQSQQPPGQGRDGESVPRRVQDHHRRRVHQSVDRGRLQSRRHAVPPCARTTS